MKQKIEWYREVLELEPGSRVFFPLAKLLAADGQTSDAVFTLQQGLLRHPDHVEARLLLVELLFLQNDGPELKAELDGLGGLFSSYPGFWKAWSERLAATPALHDAALAMRFFAAALEGKEVGWATIIEHGMQAVMGEGGHLPQALGGRLVHTLEDEVPVPAPEVDFSALEQAAAVFVAPPETEPFANEQAVVLPDASPEVEEEEQEEGFSLRTRSMAEVLAEQGDIVGALEIYEELLQNADPSENNSLEGRAEELRRRLGAPQGAEEKTEVKAPAASGESNRLVTLLESLAQRLESRAR